MPAHRSGVTQPPKESNDFIGVFVRVKGQTSQWGHRCPYISQHLPSRLESVYALMKPALEMVCKKKQDV